MPTGLSPDWRPYENGHWVYTDDWGWYWVSDDTEEDLAGWSTTTAAGSFDPGTGWFWIPGDEWAPAWVDWRYGGDTVGWAPLPPDGVDVDAYEAEPAYWVFVPDRYITAPRAAQLLRAAGKARVLSAQHAHRQPHACTRAARTSRSIPASRRPSWRG